MIQGRERSSEPGASISATWKGDKIRLCRLLINRVQLAQMGNPTRVHVDPYYWHRELYLYLGLVHDGDRAPVIKVLPNNGAGSVTVTTHVRSALLKRGKIGVLPLGILRSPYSPEGWVFGPVESIDE